MPAKQESDERLDQIVLNVKGNVSERQCSGTSLPVIFPSFDRLTVE